MTPGAVRDDGETWMALQPAAARGLSSGAVAVGGLEVRRALGGTNERR
jgi:hypothetical protein